MADQPQNPWISFLEWIKNFIKDNWSGLAVLLWGIEEQRVDAAVQDKETAALKEAESENENKVLKEFSGKSDADIISDFSKSSDPNKSDT